MARFRRLIHSVASGYIVLAGSAFYALATVPLALHYLSKERFALWALLAAIAGYLSLIDLGMSAAVARLLIDHKDERATGAYGSLVKTGWLVLIVQAALILVAGWILAPSITSLLEMPAELHGEFVLLLRWQSGLVAFSFVVRIFTHLLQAHQRSDIVNYSQVVGLALNFIFLWWFFHRGEGVFSLIWATLVNASIGALLLAFACWKLHLFPSQGQWGRSSWTYFKEMFDFGKDLFLVAVGTQLIMASQTLIIKRRLGLEVVAAWSVGTRTFSLLSQAIWRIMLFASPALSEMIVRHEQARLRERFRDILILSASLAAFVAITFAACNSLFVELWTRGRTHGPIPWAAVNDVLLGCWMIVLSLVNCHNNLVLVTKRIAFMRYVYFVEGCIFIALAWIATRPAGLPGLIVCSVLCTLVFTYAYGVWRTSDYFKCSVSEITLTWLGPMARVLFLMGPAVFLAYLAVRALPALPRLLALATVCGTLGPLILLRFGLPAALRQELAERSPKFISPFLRLLMKVTPASGSTP